MEIPVIDLFAGPGGLGEGFTVPNNNSSADRFKLSLSIEADRYAHQTLTLRSFYRQFFNNIPPEYYSFIRGEISLEKLFRKYPAEAKKAMNESWLAILGKEPVENIDKRISQSTKDKKYWVLIGGPPCQPYSVVGRSRLGGVNPDDRRVYLYREYYRILAVHSPPVFVMENVKGLLSAEVENNSIFNKILNDLKNPAAAYAAIQDGGKKLKLKCPGYRIYSFVKKPEFFNSDRTPYYKDGDYLIKAENYGIPQSRHRVILLGIRNDLDFVEAEILQSRPVVPLKKVLYGLPKLRSGLSRESDTLENWKNSIEKFLENGISDKINKHQMSLIINVIENMKNKSLNRGGEYISYRGVNIQYEPGWFLDANIKGVCNHTTKAHIVEDLHRYLFISSYANIYGISPTLDKFPTELLPAHKNVHESIKIDKFNDRFRVHLPEYPAKTITSHISKDGHYFIHYDSSQCRSFTVREAARIQTFSDNYFFCGPKTQQYKQVGNAVPPLLAKQIATSVMNVFQQIIRSKQRRNVQQKYKTKAMKYG